MTLSSLRSALLFGVLLCGCTERTALERGRSLFSSPSLSPTRINVQACIHCHDVDPEQARRKAGGSLAGVSNRPSYWNGELATLSQAVEACSRLFMLHPALHPVDEQPDAYLDLLVYLDSLEGSNAQVQRTFVSDVTGLDGDGSVDNGEALYRDTCRRCHGDRDSGGGRLSADVPILPFETVVGFDLEFSAVMEEKVRRGGFYGVGGVMPPFSLEVLSDDELRDVLTYVLVNAGDFEGSD